MHNSDQSKNFLNTALESCLDGVLVLDDRYEIVYANATAHSIYTQLAQDEANRLPIEIQCVCDALVETRDLYKGRPITIVAEQVTAETTFRIRAEWLKLEVSNCPYILLRLQDQNWCVKELANLEARQWSLTQRETEVWLLHRDGFTRKAIASKLFIARDTVKKHLQNIQSKRQAALDAQEWQTKQAS